MITHDGYPPRRMTTKEWAAYEFVKKAGRCYAADFTRANDMRKPDADALLYGLVQKGWIGVTGTYVQGQRGKDWPEYCYFDVEQHYNEVFPGLNWKRRARTNPSLHPWSTEDRMVADELMLRRTKHQKQEAI